MSEQIEVPISEDNKEGVARRLGEEFGGSIFSSAVISLGDKGSRPPFKSMLHNPDLSSAFVAGMEQSVLANARFDLQNNGVEGDELEASASEVADAYLNFVNVIQKHGLWVGGEDPEIKK